MINTIKSIYSIRATQSANCFIYYLKRIPFIGKLFSDGLYIDTSLKLILCGFISVFKFLMKFFYKALYVGLLIFLPLILLHKDAPKEDILNMGINIFVWLNFAIGALQDTVTFKVDNNRYTCVKLLNMPAKNYILANILIDSITYFITFLPSILIPGIFLGLPIYKSILLSFMIVIARLIGNVIQQFVFAKTRKLVFTKWWWYVLIYVIPLACAYLPLFKNISVNYVGGMLNIIGFIISVVLGLVCIQYIIKYPYYYDAINEFMKERPITINTKQAYAESQFAAVKLKDQDLENQKLHTAKISKLKGYDLLNAIFFERHRRLLIKPIFIRLGLVGVVFCIAVIGMFFVPQEEINKLGTTLFTSLNVFVFIMYCMSTGDKIGKAMFFNCDISLLRYGFYREKSVILKNFWIRIKKSIVFNLIPAIALCVAIYGLLLIAQVTIDYMLLFPFMASILILSVFFAVHHIFLYYVFQPYTTELNIKNPFFKLINSVVYILCFICLQIDSVPTNFVWVVLTATILYIAIAIILVLKFAPKMFKVK